MKPPRNPRYLAWIRTQPCCVCGITRGIEAAHTGPRGLGQKSPDSSAIPLCAKHHRTGNDSYHRLGPRKFSEKHGLNIPAIVRKLITKPSIRISKKVTLSLIWKGGGMCSARLRQGYGRRCERLCICAGRSACSVEV